MTQVDKIYIQKKNGEFINPTAYTMWYGCQFLNVETIGFENVEEIPIDKTIAVHGHIGKVLKQLNRLGIADPSISTIPEELLPFFGRKIWKSTLGEIRKSKRNGSVFIKPNNDHKLFNGHVSKGELKDLMEIAHLPDETRILASEVVNFISEYRLFVHNGLIVNAQHYCGDFTQIIDFDVAQEIVLNYKTAPISYSLDLGLTDNDRTLIVEVNDAFSLGAYGCPPVIYAKMIIDRWKQIVGIL